MDVQALGSSVDDRREGSLEVSGHHTGHLSEEKIKTDMFVLTMTIGLFSFEPKVFPDLFSLNNEKNQTLIENLLDQMSGRNEKQPGLF